MRRRTFLQGLAAGSVLLGAGQGSSFFFTPAIAAAMQRTLVNILLIGGADYRFLFVPEPGTPYADAFWKARKTVYRYTSADQSLYASYDDVWTDLYLPVDFNGQRFGIHKNADWLKTQFDAGNVAIISNVVGSTNRRHDHSRLMLNAGDLDVSRFDTGRDGWGGRLVGAIGAASTVASAAGSVPLFCNSLDPSNRNANVIHAKDSRNYALPGEDSMVSSDRSVLARALKDYYQQRGIQVEDDIANGRLSTTWPYRRFFQHESKLRAYGDQFRDALIQSGPQPAALQSLYSGSAPLARPDFGLQCANLYDCLLAQDVLHLRAAYLEYPDWDTHRDQKPRLEANFSDIFSSAGGLAAIYGQFGNIPSAGNNTVFVFTTDFGRQLASSSNGTDHGSGNYMILIGEPLQGGVYGEMFPASEITPATGGLSPYEKLGGDIAGLTSVERVLHRVCDWVEPGVADSVFPKAATRIIEGGVDLSGLL